MAAELVGGAFLGAAVGELLKVVIDIMKLTVVFKSNFERLESTLNAIIPLAKEIEKYKRELGRSEDEIKGLVEILKNGEILVRKCGTVTWCGTFTWCGTVTWWRNVLKRPSYSKKLKELDESLIRFFNLNMQAQLVRDANETLVEVKKIIMKIDIMGGRNGGIHQQPNGYLGSCGVPGAPAVAESCSLTPPSDYDSSSTTTEPKSTCISPKGRFKRNITSWDKGELLGRGSFGSVYEGIAEDGFFFAVKEVSLIDQGSQAKQSVFHLEQEIGLLSQFEHENIVQYYGTDEDKSKLYIFLELVTQGSFTSLYQKYHLRDSQVSSYTRQILCGLKYLHDRNVVHRDIRCANILVDANGSVKLADFGLAKATKFNDVKSCKGTAFWMAPEVVNHHNHGYGLPADIWSLGCTVLEMLTRQIPYSHLECMPALFRIGKGELPPIPDTLSRDAQDFILQCLQANPNNRPAASELLDHPFLK